MEDTRHYMGGPLQRSVPVAEVAFMDGNLEALLVPWDTPVTVFDPGEVAPYKEGFRRGAFDVQMAEFPQSIGEVRLIPQHNSPEMLGRARQLTVAENGLHGVMAVLPSKRADVEQMIEIGIDSVSIEFIPLQRAPRDAGEIRWRDRALLQAVALTSMPAYADAKVLAMRAQTLEADYEAERQAELEAMRAELAELRAGDRWSTRSD